MSTLSPTHAGRVGPPEDGNTLPLTAPAVGDEGLAEAVFIDRTLTHVRHTGPAEIRHHRLCHTPKNNINSDIKHNQMKDNSTVMQLWSVYISCLICLIHISETNTMTKSNTFAGYKNHFNSF